MVDKFQEFISDSKRQLLYEKEALAFEATELISSLLEKEGLTKAQFAKRIGRSKAYVTQLLNGSRNMTLHTFAEIAFAFGYRIQFETVSVVRPKYQMMSPAFETDWKALSQNENLFGGLGQAEKVLCGDNSLPAGFTNALAA